MQSRMRFTGNCWRSEDKLASYLILWQPQHCKQSRERPPIEYVHRSTAYDNELLRIDEIKMTMNDRERWKK